jgi:hypothetical protein
VDEERFAGMAVPLNSRTGEAVEKIPCYEYTVLVLYNSGVAALKKV